MDQAPESTPDAANPLLDPGLLPRFNEILPEHVEPALDVVLANNRQQIDDLVSDKVQPDWENFITPLEDLTDRGSAQTRIRLGRVGHWPRISSEMSPRNRLLEREAIALGAQGLSRDRLRDRLQLRDRLRDRLPDRLRAHAPVPHARHRACRRTPRCVRSPRSLGSSDR